VAALAALAAAHFLVLLPRERDETFRPAFDAIPRLDPPAPVLIYDLHRGTDEGLRGAAYFYLGRVAPALTGPEALRAAAADPGPKAIVVPVPAEPDPAVEDLPGRGFRVAFEGAAKPRVRVYVRG
jgi:hypothetical protein